MKRAMILTVLAAVMSQGHASDYTWPYLVLTDKNGVETTLPVDDLELTFSNGQLVSANGSRTQTFSLSDLASMHFSKTGDPSAISSMAAAAEGPTEVYTLSGIRVGTFADLKSARESLKTGVYVTRRNGQTTKLSIP